MDKVSFFHYRRSYINRDGNFHPYHPFGGATVAYRTLPSGEVEYGVAKCSNSDRYEKRVGRLAAEAQLKNSPKKAKNGVSFIVDVLHKLAEAHDKPVYEPAWNNDALREYYEY